MSDSSDDDEKPEVFAVEADIENLSFGKSAEQNTSAFSTAHGEPQPSSSVNGLDNQHQSTRERQLHATIDKLMQGLKELKESHSHQFEPQSQSSRHGPK